MLPIAIGVLGLVGSSSLAAQESAGKKPNILFIMGDDIGLMNMNVCVYHRGFMVGEKPNIDRIAQDGAMFMTMYAAHTPLQSCGENGGMQL